MKYFVFFFFLSIFLFLSGCSMLPSDDGEPKGFLLERETGLDFIVDEMDEDPVNNSEDELIENFYDESDDFVENNEEDFVGIDEIYFEVSE